MALDPSIALGVQPFKAPDQMNMLAQALQIQGAQSQNALAQYGLTKARRQDDESNAIAGLLRGGTDMSTPEGQAALYGAAPLSAASFLKQQLENKNIESQMQERQSIAKKNAFEQAKQGYGEFQKTVGAHITNPNATPQGVASSVTGLVQAGVMDGKVAQALLAEMPQDPTQLRPYLQRVVSAQMTPEQLLTVFAPKPKQLDNGLQISFVDENPNSPTYGKPTMGAPVQKVATPDARLTDSRVRSEGALNRAAENLRAGVSADGGLDPNAERTAQAIASGQLPAPTGMALLNPKNQRILGRVMEINPSYDSTTVAAKKAAAVSFTSGPLGGALRSVSTANAHLDQLGELVDALNNGNTQVVNKVQNYFSKATGGTAVTNFEGIKNIVGQEVVKAIVPGGGSEREREEAAKAFASANSPKQLKEVISHFRMVMGAQANNLMEQRRAAGLPDSTLPNYSNTNPTAAAKPAAAIPDGWTVKAH